MTLFQPRWQVEKVGKRKSILQKAEHKTSNMTSTHPCDPKDTFNAGKDEVEDAEPHNSVHHRPQSRPEHSTETLKAGDWLYARTHKVVGHRFLYLMMP